jgi:hypothetical protein
MYIIKGAGCQWGEARKKQTTREGAQGGRILGAQRMPFENDYDED